MDILDTVQEPKFDDVVALAADICETPIALISLIGERRQWFKSKVGHKFDQTLHAMVFSDHALHCDELMEVPDALDDKRFVDHPFVQGAPGIRFYAGIPLVDDGGATLGTLCVMDGVPRQLTQHQKFALRVLSKQVMAQMQLRRDIAERRRAERRLERMNRLYAVSSGVNDAILRINDMQQLYEEACRIAVVQGEMHMAWVGMTEPGGKMLKVVAHHGNGEGYFDMGISMLPEPLGLGPSGRAFRENQVVLCNDIAADTSMAPWRDEALKRGYRSCACLPLRIAGRPIGVYAVYGDYPGFFNAEELQFLSALADSLSFAIESHSREQQRLRTETIMRASEARMAAAQSIGHFGSWELDLAEHETSDETPLHWSDEMFRIMMGHEPGTVKVTRALFYSLVHPDDRKNVRETVNAAIRGRHQYTKIHRIIRPDGEERLVHETAQLFYDELTGAPARMIGTTHDITEQRRVEEKLRAREREQRELARQLEIERSRLVAAQQVAKIGSWETNIANLSVIWSEETHRIFETDPAAFIPTHGGFLEHVHPDDRALVHEAFISSLDQSAARVIEHRIVMPDGTVKLVEERWQAVCDDQGKPLRAIGTCQDITERKQSEEILRESEQRFRQLAENINEVFWLTDPAKDQMLYISPAYEKIWGRSCESLYKSPTDWLEAIHPEDRERVQQAAMWKQAAGDYDETYRIVRKDGTVRWIRDRAYPVRNEQGKIYRMVGIAEDITEARQAEDKLREQATLLDKAQDAILVRDLDRGIVYWNRSAERLYGWTAAEAMGRSSPDFLCRDIAEFQAALDATLTKGEWVGELQQWNKDGQNLAVEARWTLVRDDQQNPKSILAINTDITGRRKLEQQFLRAQRMESIGTLAGGIAHDLNNVLTPIMMSIQLLKLKEKDPKHEAVLTTIESSAKRGADMVKQVLSFARGVEGQQLEVQAGRLIEEIENIANDTFLKNVQIRKDIPAGLWLIKGDPTQLHQVLLNLCINARDAMPGGGTLTLSASNMLLDEHFAGMNIDARPGPHVIIQVEDTGTGMPPELIDRIFEPFFTTKEPGKGTGLGLSTTLAIVKSHGGLVRVHSEAGVGTQFRVYLPAQATIAASNDAAAEMDLPLGNGELVMVVDDEAAVRAITRETLEAFGYRVLLAADGIEASALYALHEDDVSVVLTDMMMPIMDGTATIHVLKSLNPKVRIIAASGLNADGMQDKAARAGASHFLPKPYTAQTLLTALGGVLLEVA